ncbi:hypothetical protein HY485_04815 [Candidatus Woesearchaeota archaeon]|nr:hypothetical protein [Candidatus Woesearchaeota archaeon]
MLRKLLTTAILATCLQITGCATIALPVLSSENKKSVQEKPEEKIYSRFYLKLNDKETIFGYDINNDGIIDEAFYSRTKQATDILYATDGNRRIKLSNYAIQKEDLEHLTVNGLPPENEVGPHPKNTRLMTRLERELLTKHYQQLLSAYYRTQEEEKK